MVFGSVTVTIVSQFLKLIQVQAGGLASCVSKHKMLSIGTHRRSSHLIRQHSPSRRCRKGPARYSCCLRTPRNHLGTEVRPCTAGASPCVLYFSAYSSSLHPSSHTFAFLCQSISQPGTELLEYPMTNKETLVKASNN